MPEMRDGRGMRGGSYELSGVSSARGILGEERTLGEMKD